MAQRDIRKILSDLEEIRKKLDDPVGGLSAVQQSQEGMHRKVLEHVTYSTTGVREENREVRRRLDRTTSDLGELRGAVESLRREIAQAWAHTLVTPRPPGDDASAGARDGSRVLGAGVGGGGVPEGGDGLEESDEVTEGERVVAGADSGWGVDGPEEEQPREDQGGRRPGREDPVEANTAAVVPAVQASFADPVADPDTREEAPEAPAAGAGTTASQASEADADKAEDVESSETPPEAEEPPAEPGPVSDARTARDRYLQGLLDAAEVSSARLICHKDLWSFILERTVNEAHFRLPDSVVSATDGQIEADLSGRSLLAILVTMHGILQNEALPNGDLATWALAATVNRRLQLAVAGAEPMRQGDGSMVTVIIDDKPN